MIFFENVVKSFGSHKVLDGLSLHIPKGKVTFILGKSGEGKSVAIKHIMGLMQPDSGKIIVDGDDITHFSNEQLRFHRKKFGMLFQHAALFDSMSVEENVLFPLQEEALLSEKEQILRMESVLEQTGILELRQKFPSELSTGEKKRVGLSRALATHPKIILYDEPTTGMDPLVSEMIDQLILKVNSQQEHMTSVVISHDLTAALNTADKIIMLYKGKVALEGAPNDFRETLNPVVRQFFSGKTVGPMEFF